ncbi:MAG TPA: hypothetical protein PKC28_03285 [Bdellovibrionales bacterium]|nr:hypothetical protein [Bdellovibrionales bacterium]
MMRAKLLLFSKRILASVCLSAGVLAIANVDTMRKEQDHANDLSRVRLELAKERVRERLHVKAPTPSLALHDPARKLRDSLSQDEFGDISPFGDLSTLEPLSELMRKGVKSFERQAFRSPEYQGEIGYDILHYRIHHADGSTSEIMAYLERALTTESRNVGAPDEREPVVMSMVADQDRIQFSYFKANVLKQRSELSSSDAQALVEQRLSSGVPFLSVAR